VTPKPLRGVLFDVDGTLVDTVYIHTICWWEALRQAGHDVPMATVHRGIGLGSAELLDHLLGADRDRGDDEKMKTVHLGLYQQYWHRLCPLPGARGLVRACAARGRQVVLASSASADELDALRSALDADEAISHATSASDAGAGKPAPDILQAALDGGALRADEVVLVGDAVWDGHAAGKLGIPFVGVESGGNCPGELRDAGAVATYPDAAALLHDLDRGPLA
jgi:HAD superfamily hydrolase (TIGR01509 family)